MKKGISLIVLIVTIIIVALLSTTAIFKINTDNEKYLKSDFAKELYMITDRVEEYYLFNKKYPLKNNITIDVTAVSVELQNDLSDENIVSNEVTLKEIDLYKADISGNLKGNKENGNSLDIYAFSEDTKRVYYLKGFQIGNEIYYSLNGELKDFLSVYKVN